MNEGGVEVEEPPPRDEPLQQMREREVSCAFCGHEFNLDRTTAWALAG